MEDKTGFDKTKARGEVIEKMANIETIMNAIISQKYLKITDINFYLDVLYDDNFSFALRRNIIEKIILKEKNSKKVLEDLHKLGKIRNYMAHIDLAIYSYDEKTTKYRAERTPDPKKNEKDIDFQKLYEEFMKISPLMEKYLFSIFEKLGGKTVINTD